ncbi:enoyl-CoA hydratase-related protein [Pseudomarimonas arenosa]|uniref:Enoyl-CoA hydratase/isomerase family protein n=1 Tax=Pseudomarimonas arenosa TaxID=2774145 RepID=A0AAW3ZLY8_9GAMM|nr:enoyl-CoA hydratase-related protein [Pseudomarimonas arenosa]MBD8526549.1 enoyl-CoA hydratase/isomerase family protein [Pseudomarimonas arenosa]
MAFQTLHCEDAGAVRRIIINRPDKLNALNRQTLADLHQAFDQAAADDTVRVIVLSGAGGKAFVAGADISELAELSPIEARELSRFGQRLMRKIETLGKPVIAEVAGFCLGGGMELAMACHLRLASRKAKFGQPEVNLGVIPGFGGTQRLLRLTSRAAALELCLLGEQIDAERAYQLGIINAVFEPEQLAEEVQKRAEHMAALAPQALRGVIEAITVGAESALDVGLEFETQAFAVAFSTEDMREGTQAFLARRPAEFKGR